MTIMANLVCPTRKPDTVSLERQRARNVAEVRALVASIAERVPSRPAERQGRAGAHSA